MHGFAPGSVHLLILLLRVWLIELLLLHLGWVLGRGLLHVGRLELLRRLSTIPVWLLLLPTIAILLHVGVLLNALLLVIVLGLRCLGAVVLLNCG